MVPKTKAKGVEIQAAMQKRIRESKEMDGDCRGCGAPTPRRADPANYGGSNWTADWYPKMTPGCEGFMKTILQTAMKEYELVDG